MNEEWNFGKNWLSRSKIIFQVIEKYIEAC